VTSRQTGVFLLAALGAITSIVMFRVLDNAPGTPQTSAPFATLATVAGRPITVEAFSTQMIRRSGGFAGQFTTIEQKKLLLDEMVQRELQVVRAREAGYDRDPDVIATLERIMVSKLREDQLAQHLAEITVTDTEIDQYYQSHRPDYTKPEMLRIAIIRFELSPNAGDEKRAEIQAKAEEVLKQAANLDASVRGFGPLAARHSQDQASRYIGGDIGWVRRDKPGRFDDPVFVQAVASLHEPGELSQVIEAKKGLYLIKLLEIRAQQTRSIAEVSNGIHHLIMKQKRAETEATWLSSLLDEHTPVEINHSVLESVPSPPGTTVLKKHQQPPALPKS